MATTRLDTALKNYEQMNQMVERYTRLCRAYVKLSERFQELDIANMTLKGQLVSLIKTTKAQQQQQQRQSKEYQRLLEAFNSLRANHQQELQELTHSYEDRIQDLTSELVSLTALQTDLFAPDVQEALTEAETQSELLEEAFQEMATDGDPDLNSEEKALLAEFQANPSLFAASPDSEMIAPPVEIHTPSLAL